MEKKPIYVRNYDNERKAFRRVLELPDAVFSEFEAALKSLVYQYSTTDYENRFVTGAAVELLVKCLLELAYTHVDSVGGHAKGIDLSSADLRFSVKAQFGTFSDIRLRNIMGSANAGSTSTLGEWSEATVMLIPNVGLVYGDPESSILQAGLYWAKDALIMRKSAVLEYIQLNPDYVRPLEVPQNDGVVRQVASTSVVATLLADPQYPLLQKAFMRRRSIDSRIGRLAELEQLLARGAIDQEKFAQLKEQALRD